MHWTPTLACTAPRVQGIHHPEYSRPTILPPRSPGRTVSTALHQLPQLQMEWGGLDYAFMSPVFNSITKVGYGAAFDIDELTHAVKCCDLPVIALGGAVLSSPFRVPPASSVGFS